MTLEEAIIHCKEKACGNTQCALEHRQLAEWLQELQSLRSYKNNSIEERARLAAYQIYEGIGLSRHSVDRVSEIIEEKMLEQKAIDDAKWLKIKSSWEKEAQINHDDVANYKQGYHDAREKFREWLKNNWREYVYQDGDGIIHFGHWESDFRKAKEEQI